MHATRLAGRLMFARRRRWCRSESQFVHSGRMANIMTIVDEISFMHRNKLQSPLRAAHCLLLLFPEFTPTTTATTPTPTRAYHSTKWISFESDSSGESEYNNNGRWDCARGHFSGQRASVVHAMRRCAARGPSGAPMSSPKMAGRANDRVPNC